jgi:hypothetical protein
MHNEKANKSKLVAVTIAAVILLTTAAITMTTSESVFAYKKSQATSQTSACGNGLVSTNIGCQNTDSQIQGDENAVALTAQQTFPAITEESSSSPPTQSPTEEICDDGLDDDGDGAIDMEDIDCEQAPPLEDSDQPLEQ